MSRIEAQMTRRRVGEVVLAVLVLVASAMTTWIMLRRVGPALPDMVAVPGGMGLLLVLAVDVPVAMALRGYGHLQLALSTGSNVVLQGFAAATILGRA